jgi:hypothetical protein
MIQGGGSARFLLEPAPVIGIVAGGGPDQLQGHITAEPLVAGAEDLAHAASADFLQDSIMPD